MIRQKHSYPFLLILPAGSDKIPVAMTASEERISSSLEVLCWLSCPETPGVNPNREKWGMH